MDLNYRKIITEYLGCKVKTDINDFDTCEMQCYNESTADGYDIYVLKYTLDEISINDNVYYYNHDIAEQIMYHIKDYNVASIYIDNYLEEEIYLDDIFEEYFHENVEEITSNSPELFTKDELKYLWEEYDISIKGSEG